MRPIQFGAEARLKIQASESRKIPKPFADLNPVQDTFDDFERRVEGIEHKKERYPGRRGEYTVDQQYAIVVIDHEGARTEIKTNYNGNRVIPTPAGFKNTDRGWKAYFQDVLTELRRYETTLLSKERRFEKDLNGSKRLISQIAPGLATGYFEVLGDPDQLESQLFMERAKHAPEPVKMDVQIGERIFAVTRHYSGRGSIWMYQFQPKGGQDILEVEFNAAISPGFSPMTQISYQDEHGVKLDLDAYYRKLLDGSQGDVDWRLNAAERQEAREKQTALANQAIALWNEQLGPMMDALRNLDDRTRKRHLHHDRPH